MKMALFLWICLSCLLIACRDPVASDPVNLLSVSAKNLVTMTRPTSFRTVVTVANPTNSTIGFQFNCGSELRLMPVSDSLGVPVWSSVSPETECGGAAHRQILGSGEEIGYEEAFSISSINQTLVSDGPYRVEAIVVINGTVFRANAGRVDIRR